GEKPLHCFRDSFSHSMLSLKAKQLFGPTHIEAAAGLTVWLGHIPNNLSAETNFRGNDLREFFNSELFTRAQVDWLWTVVPLSSQKYSFGSVLYVQKFPRRRAIAPQQDLIASFFLCFNTLADERGNDMRSL